MKLYEIGGSNYYFRLFLFSELGTGVRFFKESKEGIKDKICVGIWKI